MPPSLTRSGVPVVMWGWLRDVPFPPFVYESRSLRALLVLRASTLGFVGLGGERVLLQALAVAPCGCSLVSPLLCPWQVSIVRSTTITLSQTSNTETDVSLVYRGFIHPLLPGGPGASGADDVIVWARAQRLRVLARMSRGPDSQHMVRVMGSLEWGRGPKEAGGRSEVIRQS